MHLNWILNPEKIIWHDDKLEVLPSHHLTSQLMAI